MPSNTLIESDDDLGDILATYVFDVALADSLLSSSGLALAGCLTTLAAVTLFVDSVAVSVITSIGLVVLALSCGWGLLLAVTRLRRKGDRFVVRRLGLARLHGETVTHTKWIDIASVVHTGSGSGSRTDRWGGSDYRCTIGLRNGELSVFDNYIVEAEALGREIGFRSLL